MFRPRPIQTAAFVVALMSCSTSWAWGEAQTDAFPISAEQADAFILKAIAEHWPKKEPKALDDGRNGYRIRLHWAIDYDNVYVTWLTDDAGEIYFNVHNKGTAPASGDPGREKLIASLERLAKDSAE